MDDFSIASLHIRKVVETSSQEESNKLLDDDWYLLNCFTKDELNIYVLGLPQTTIDQKNSPAYKLV